VTLAEFLAGVVDHLDRLSIAYMVGGSTASSRLRVCAGVEVEVRL